MHCMWGEKTATKIRAAMRAVRVGVIALENDRDSSS